MSRRSILIAIAAVLVGINVVYFSNLFSTFDEEPDAAFVAWMPALEAKQRLDPSNPLAGVHVWDPEYPPMVALEDGQAISLLGKAAAECNVTSFTVKRFTGKNATDFSQMPDRLFLGLLSSDQLSCLYETLPDGYELTKLSELIKPTQIGWDYGQLPVDISPSNGGSTWPAEQEKLTFVFPDGVRGGFGRIQGDASKSDEGSNDILIDQIRMCGAWDAHYRDVQPSHSFSISSSSTTNDLGVARCVKQSIPSHFSVYGSEGEAPFQELWTSLVPESQGE